MPPLGILIPRSDQELSGPIDGFQWWQKALLACEECLKGVLLRAIPEAMIQEVEDKYYDHLLRFWAEAESDVRLVVALATTYVVPSISAKSKMLQSISECRRRPEFDKTFTPNYAAMLNPQNQQLREHLRSYWQWIANLHEHVTVANPNASDDYKQWLRSGPFRLRWDLEPCAASIQHFRKAMANYRKRCPSVDLAQDCFAEIYYKLYIEGMSREVLMNENVTHFYKENAHTISCGIKAFHDFLHFAEDYLAEYGNGGVRDEVHMLKEAAFALKPVLEKALEAGESLTNVTWKIPNENCSAGFKIAWIGYWSKAINDVAHLCIYKFPLWPSAWKFPPLVKLEGALSAFKAEATEEFESSRLDELRDALTTFTALFNESQQVKSVPSPQTEAVSSLTSCELYDTSEDEPCRYCGFMLTIPGAGK